MLMTVYIVSIWCYCGLEKGIMKKYFYVHDSTWNNSVLCQVAFISILSFSLLEPYHLSLLSLARIMVVLYPFKSYFKMLSFILKCILGGSLLVVIIVLGASKLFQTKQLMVTTLCSPYVDPSDSVFAVMLLTWIVGCVQLTVLIFICTTHIFLIMYLNSQQKNKTIKITNVVNFHRSIMHQLLVVSFSKLISWITPTIVFVSALHLSRYPQDLLLWTTLFAPSVSCNLNSIFHHFFWWYISKLKPKITTTEIHVLSHDLQSIVVCLDWLPFIEHNTDTC